MTNQSTILLMDQDTESLEQLHSILRRQGYHILTAADGDAALRLAGSVRPDLVISDVFLGGLDGYEVWRQFRAEKELANVPVLVTSALTIPASNKPWRPTPYAEWQLLQYDAFLPKPLDLPRFIRVVQKLLSPEIDLPQGPSLVLAIPDQDLQQQLVEIFSSRDFGVEVVGSLQRALRLIQALPPAALLLDYRQPNPEVQTMARRIKRSIPFTSIILLVEASPQLPPDTGGLCDGMVCTSLPPDLLAGSVAQVLELNNMERRTRSLSGQFMTMNRDLQQTRHTLQAQNEELAYTNARLRELDSLKEMLTGMVVHDLKAPLGAVLGTLTFLLTSPKVSLPENIVKLVTGSVAAGHQLLRLIETLLEGQRLEEGRLRPDKEPFDLPTLFEVSLQQISPLLALHHLNVDCVIEEDLPLIYADPHISQRIMENLLDNAIKFSPPNSTITITAVADGDYARISVADQGPGIPKEQQSEVFNRFVQIKQPHMATSRVGFGLGLAFCQIATTAMDSSIWVESDGESGTTFSFTLPFYYEE